MATVKSTDLKTLPSSLNVSNLGKYQYKRIPGSNTYIRGDGSILQYNSNSNQFERVGSHNGKTYNYDATPSAVTTNANSSGGLQDNGMSDQIVQELNEGYMPYTTSNNTRTLANDAPMDSILHNYNLFSIKEMDLHNKTYRFGYFNKENLSYAKEFLFFSKPDLHIFGESMDSKVKYPYKSDCDLTKMNSFLATIPFWNGLGRSNTGRKTISLLQTSLPTEAGGNPDDKFNHLLQNQCTSNLEVPSLSSEMVETATNTYGVGFTYRGSSEASDDKPTFSLEFKDTKYLDVYYYFKAYEEYETLKHHGVISPFKDYIESRVVHDQMCIYKFLVDEDMETILYYGKMYGVVPKSLPRDVFSNTNFDNGLTYSIDFEAAFYEDMDPKIIKDFNDLSYGYCAKLPYTVDIYNNVLDSMDNRAVQAARVDIVKSLNNNQSDSEFLRRSPGGYVFKLRWKGSDVV